LGFHDRREFPLGVPKKWWVDYEQHKVYALVYFPTVAELSTDPNYASEKAKLVDFTYHCYKTGLLRAVSIGFMVKEYTRNANSEYGNIIKKWELLEFSAVTVPANADAVLVAAKSFGISDVDVQMFKPETKAGKRISAQTRKAIEDMKDCMDEMKACQKEMIKMIEDLLAEHEVMPEEPDEPEEQEEPEDDSAGGSPEGKSAAEQEPDYIDLSSISLPDGEVLIDLIFDN
jgi:hypothetical protein